MESIEEFYNYKFGDFPNRLSQSIGQFNVFRIEDRLRPEQLLPPHVRRNFYKIMLYDGENIFHYGDQSITVKGKTLLFFQPRIPYSYDVVSTDTKGYFCVFKEEFYKENIRLNLSELPLFDPGVIPVYELGDEEYDEVKAIFERMSKEINTSYVFKYELIRSYISQLLFLAMKTGQNKNQFKPADAGTRITSKFIEMLEQQFLVEFSSERLLLRTPKDFADRLAVHVNYLNRIIKISTGRTTSEIIYDRINSEAKILLKYTRWNISEIGYALGFDDQAHFNKFFKKQEGISPSSYRLV
ncbi:helix-turn-helix domain-containing protein [Pedobacter hartonius]|uniref:AraC-type DNA-binding protein n=1 Tax=Pedobacter hartonius TaxID=425514 RepID=A0A1H3WPD8_9SPHI|nr:helix-turn-helix domain-containing protein [Pedobacter hartonius]SDZ89047.1 AraC-type DNA-binding protein [Pedobacter hartonius]